jgi:hypothetical protein
MIAKATGWLIGFALMAFLFSMLSSTGKMVLGMIILSAVTSYTRCKNEAA